MNYEVKHGDSRELIKNLPDNSVDSIITDPPYELNFCGYKWDNSGIAFDKEFWQECLRVLKPGGYLLSFSGSRTYHRMAVAIEDAGFQIKDQAIWLYDQGFPKSLNISKSIDKRAGAEREVIGTQTNKPNSKNSVIAFQKSDKSQKHFNITAPATDEAKQWDGWGTQLSPAHEPICFAKKPISEKTITENVLKWGTGGINIEESRIPLKKNDKLNDNGRTIKVEGRWPKNVMHDGSEAVEPIFEKLNKESASRFFFCAKPQIKEREEGLQGYQKNKMASLQGAVKERENMDGLSQRFVGQPVANNHPTLKPVALMQHLCKLITQPNGLILDPFTGSGTTGKGAIKEGFNFIGFEQDEHYCEIARARIEWELQQRKSRLF